MDIKYAIAEGFTVNIVKDCGGSFSSDKACSECMWCHGPGYVLTPLIYTPSGMLILPVHEWCFEEANRFLIDHINTS